MDEVDYKIRPLSVEEEDAAHEAIQQSIRIARESMKGAARHELATIHVDLQNGIKISCVCYPEESPTTETHPSASH